MSDPTIHGHCSKTNDNALGLVDSINCQTLPGPEEGDLAETLAENNEDYTNFGWSACIVDPAWKERELCLRLNDNKW
ncbi:hypothetical protein Y032_0085g1853 [Ancylostoma ceylanicum]|nr:hypothetical protein Y032_0085g1853 [Ancylostoma ceylanicum]